VGKVIALLAEEGDDISNLEAPKEEPKPATTEAKPSSSPAPTPTSVPSTSAKPDASTQTPSSGHPKKHPEHSKPLFPSVLRLLSEYNVADPEKIKGTGVRGMLTKGDVLAHLGKASGPTGTYKEPSKAEREPGSKVDKPVCPIEQAPHYCH
jgi:pyruvate/2-oxoglutarate dehydrogenase complex dihydrolipoamide acyltransferase (E2) component